MRPLTFSYAYEVLETLGRAGKINKHHLTENGFFDGRYILHMEYCLREEKKFRQRELVILTGKTNTPTKDYEQVHTAWRKKLEDLWTEVELLQRQRKWIPDGLVVKLMRVGFAIIKLIEIGEKELLQLSKKINWDDITPMDRVLSLQSQAFTKVPKIQITDPTTGKILWNLRRQIIHKYKGSSTVAKVLEEKLEHKWEEYIAKRRKFGQRYAGNENEKRHWQLKTLKDYMKRSVQITRKVKYDHCEDMFAWGKKKIGNEWYADTFAITEAKLEELISLKHRNGVFLTKLVNSQKRTISFEEKPSEPEDYDIDFEVWSQDEEFDDLMMSNLLAGPAVGRTWEWGPITFKGPIVYVNIPNGELLEHDHSDDKDMTAAKEEIRSSIHRITMAIEEDNQQRKRNGEPELNLRITRPRSDRTVLVMRP